MNGGDATGESEGVQPSFRTTPRPPPIARRAEAAFTPEVMSLLEKRTLARSRGEFATADALRGELEERGFVLEDEDGGTRIRPAR